ncbi:MAG TPA: hypothetical protein VFN67_35355 [Polyangiales bacterium]|nr:hypothetical protein [Polyangiales bacterium]
MIVLRRCFLSDLREHRIELSLGGVGPLHAGDELVGEPSRLVTLQVITFRCAT